MKEFHPEFAPHDRFRFLLRANPTVKHEGKRNGLLDGDQQRAWLLRKASQAGFAVDPDSLVVLAVRPRVSRRSRQIDPEPHTHLAVDFSGLLCVTAPAAFREAFIRGIGPAKAYGFGLLSLARVGP
jgi:CRISPR system Cascade subunit CasE